MPRANAVVNGVGHAILANNLSQQLGQGDLPIDHQLTQKDHLTGRYSIADNRETDPNAYPASGRLLPQLLPVHQLTSGPEHQRDGRHHGA